MIGCQFHAATVKPFLRPCIYLVGGSILASYHEPSATLRPLVSLVPSKSFINLALVEMSDVRYLPDGRGFSSRMLASQMDNTCRTVSKEKRALLKATKGPEWTKEQSWRDVAAV